MNTNYEQGWKQNRQFQFPRTRRQLWADTKRAAWLIAALILWVAYMSTASGCATAPQGTGNNSTGEVRLATGGPSGFVQRVRMGIMNSCDDPQQFIEKIVRFTLGFKGVKTPDVVDVTLLPGSSACGVQTTSNEVLDSRQGAHGFLEAEVQITWQQASKSNIQDAKDALAMMKPPAPRLTSK